MLVVFALALLLNICFAGDYNCVCESQKRGFPINCSNTQYLLNALERLRVNSCAGNCETEICKTNYFIILAHHDHCLPSEIPQVIENEIHDFEDHCEECDIKRKYNPDLVACNLQPNCTVSSIITDAVVTLVKNNCSYDCDNKPMECGPAFRTLRSFHDLCGENDIPQLAEELLHLYEESCKTTDCNTGFPNDLLVCSSGFALSSSMISILLISIAFYLF